MHYRYAFSFVSALCCGDQPGNRPSERYSLPCHEDSLSLSLSLSVLTAIFPGEPGLAGFIEVLTMEVVVTTGAIRRAKFTSNHHHQQSNIQCFTDRMPFLSPNQQCQSTEGRRLDTKIYWSLTALTPWYSSWCFEAFLRSKSLLSH